MAADKFLAESKEEMKEHGQGNKFGKLVAGRVKGPSKAANVKAKGTLFGNKIPGKRTGSK